MATNNNGKKGDSCNFMRHTELISRICCNCFYMACPYCSRITIVITNSAHSSLSVLKKHWSGRQFLEAIISHARVMGTRFHGILLTPTFCFLVFSVSSLPQRRVAIQASFCGNLCLFSLFLSLPLGNTSIDSVWNACQSIPQASVIVWLGQTLRTGKRAKRNSSRICPHNHSTRKFGWEVLFSSVVAIPIPVATPMPIAVQINSNTGTRRKPLAVLCSRWYTRGHPADNEMK